MAIKTLPRNAKPKATCVIEGCEQPRHGKRKLCWEHFEEETARLNPTSGAGKGFTVATTFAKWEADTVTPQLWYGKFKVYGIKPIGSMFSLVLGKHDVPVIVPADTKLTLVKAL